MSYLSEQERAERENAREAMLEQRAQAEYEAKQQAQRDHTALRDQFACAALTVMAGYQSIPDLVAQKSYEFADAMMKAREVQP